MADDDLRPGETTVDLPPADDARLRFIGRLRTPFKTRGDCPRQGSFDGPECRVELDPRLAPALDGIERSETIGSGPTLDARGQRSVVSRGMCRAFAKVCSLRGITSIRAEGFTHRPRRG